VTAAAIRAAGRAEVIGVTGPPGAGKSTLVSALAGHVRRSGRTVGIVAVDPSSAASGGAVLGDRIRMSAHAGDEGVFVRSLASRGQLGGLALATAQVVDVMDAAGREVVIVETVGTGQSEIAVADLADCCLLVAPPGLGDDVQALKAGVLEIADIVVVNKADRPGAAETARVLAARTGLPVVRTVATDGSGIDDLARAIARRQRAVPPHRDAPPHRAGGRLQRVLPALAADHARRALLAADPALVEAAAARLAAAEAPLPVILGDLVRRALAGAEPPSSGDAG
ncbi:ArgK/MeaB family GTPase, partial [Marinibaculum pumilum]